ncbi:nose resistant to fluoxetine protein 6 isoform X1 [Aedes aegypti]|uniref:Acyltransferase 3 domain-containing protein n=2 Tax=Aedes aegypti TaxID=7159 RepID=A0A1S4FGP7_AEDAE|nr:nose resistant to fluoxetine protein 6 isoform X1 [Aedes aegypti]
MIGHFWMRMLVVVFVVALTVVVVDCQNYDHETVGRFPALFEYDDFESCRKTYRERYVYCIVRAKIVPDDESLLWQNMSLVSEDNFYYDHRVLERGMCVQNCLANADKDTVADLNGLNQLRTCINHRLQKSHDLQIDPDLHIYHCYNKPNEDPPYDALEIVFFITIAVLTLLVCYSTWYDLSLQSAHRYTDNYFSKSHTTSQQKLLTAFSIPRNLRRIGHTANTEIRRDLNFLESFRFIQMYRIISLHVVMALVKVPKSNPEDLELMVNQPAAIEYVAEFQNYVQTFFSITGMLMTINFLEHIRKNPQFNMKYFWERIRARMYRIVPAYLFILLLETSITRRFMDGPLAELMIGQSRASCRQSWWKNLLFVNNYIDTDKPCLIQSWYLSADLQLFTFALGCLMLIWRWPFLKKYILGIGLTWGLVVTTIVAYLGRIPPVMTEDLKLYNNYNFGHPYFQLYQPFHMNITIYFAGMIAGFVYHRYRESRKEFFKCQLQFNLLQVFLFLYFSTVFTGWWVVRNQSVISPILVAIYATCFKHVWGFLCTMIQIRTALATSWSRFRNFFSHPIFIILGKLCYSFYLIHFTVIVQVVGSAKQPIFYSMRAIFEYTFTTCIWSLIFGTLLCILVELPSNVALQELFESRSEKKSTDNDASMPNRKIHKDPSH